MGGVHTEQNSLEFRKTKIKVYSSFEKNFFLCSGRVGDRLA